MRADLEIIQEWIPAGSRVLDLGCGDGSAPGWLRDHKGQRLRPGDRPRQHRPLHRKRGERDRAGPRQGPGQLRQRQLRRGGDDPGATGRALSGQDPRKNAAGRQDLHHHLPQLRPLALPLVPGAQRPDAGLEFLPYTWYNTPNIHFCTFQDFERLCRQLRMRVLDRLAVDRDHRHGWASRLWPNLLGEIGIYRVTGPGVQTHNLAV